MKPKPSNIVAVMVLLTCLGVGYVFTRDVPSIDPDDLGKLNIYDAIVCKPVIAKDTHYQTRLCITGVRHGPTLQKLQMKVQSYWFGHQRPAQGSKIRVRTRIEKTKYGFQAKISSDTRWTYLEHVRPKKHDDIAAQYMSVDAYQLFSAIKYGSASMLSDHVREHARRLGVIHLFAFSGFHVGVCFGLFWFLMFPMSMLRTRSFMPQIRINMAWLMTTMYVLGAIPTSMPTLRAWLFLSLFVASRNLCWKLSWRRVWFISIVMGCVLMPQQMFGLSSLLSFAAVLGILWSLELADIWSKRKWVKWIGAHFVVSMGAMLWTLPVMLGVFGMLYPLSFAVNMLLVPTIGALMIGLSILLDVSLFVTSGVWISMLGKILSMVSKYFVNVLEVLSPGADQVIRVGTPHAWFVPLGFGVLIITYLYFENQNKKKKPFLHL